MTGIIGSLYTIERFGRRTLIITATCILIIINTIIASLGFVEQSATVQNTTLALICIWVFSYSCGLSGSCWSAPAECPTLRLRAKTMSAILGTNALSNVLYGSTVSSETRQFANGLTGAGTSHAVDGWWQRRRRLGSKDTVSVRRSRLPRPRRELFHAARGMCLNASRDIKC